MVISTDLLPLLSSLCKDGKVGINGRDGRDGKDGKDGINGKDGWLVYLLTDCCFYYDTV